MQPAQRDALLTALLLSPRMQSLWDVRDRGMPVYAHTIDVALLCLDRVPPGSELDTPAILLAALIHDYSKLPLPEIEGRSHSYLMRNMPGVAAAVSLDLLADAERRSGVTLDDDRREHIRHIVAAHHGQHGKVRPRTAEAHIVADCDFESSTEYRLAPFDANDILPLLSEGYRWGEAAALLGVGRELIKTRLREACLAEGVREWIHLLPIWRARGGVTVGSRRHQERLARARRVSRLARQVPDCLLMRLAAASPALGSPQPV